MKRPDLSGYDADDEPVISHFNQNDAFSRTEDGTADDFHASLAKTLAAGELPGQPGNSAKDGDDQCECEPGLQITASRDARLGAVAGVGRKRKQEGKDALQQVNGLRIQRIGYLKPKPCPR